MIRLMLVVICWLALAAPALAGYDEDVAAVERGDHGTAMREFRPALSVTAQTLPGSRYRLAQTVVSVSGFC